MIHNDKELKVTQQRVAYFQNLLLQLRVKQHLKNFRLSQVGIGWRYKRCKTKFLNI